MVNAKVKANLSDLATLPVEGVAVESIGILLVDDSNSIRETIRHYLTPQPDFAIVGSVDNAQTAIEQIKTLDPDIVLMDIEMPGMDGIKATEAISQQFARSKVIVLSSHHEEQYVDRVLNAGAKGYLLKTTPIEELVNSIRFVHKGYFQFSPGLLKMPDSGRAIAVTAQSSTRSNSEIVSAFPNQLQSHDWSSQTKELIDTLPRVWTRGLFYFLAIFASVALPWTMLAQVDETGTARGRLEPSDKTFILDAPVAGTVAKINVKEGDVVETGQSLLALESDIVSAELQQLQTQLAGQENKLNQLELLKEQLLLTVNTQEQETQAQKLEKLAQVNQAEQNVVYSQTAHNSAKKALAKAQKEIERYRQAGKEGVIAEIQVVEQEDLLAEKQQAYDRAQSELQQARLRLQEQEKGDRTLTHTGKLAILKSQEQLKNVETEIATLTAEIAQIKSQITSAKYQLNQRAIQAPVKGTVFNLLIQKSGEVLQPGDTIAEIAPEGSPLVVMAQMATSESGSIKKGMPVKLKFDAYPFQDYGIVTGKLSDISPTSKLTDTEQGQVANYNLEIQLDRDCLPTGNKCVPLRPGDTVTAEVIVRQRRVIDFILDPFKKLQQGGLEL